MSALHCFTNARDWNVGSITINNTNPSGTLEKAFQYLYGNIAEDAAHNSAERHDAPKCHEDTRKAVQEEIHGWITHGDEDAEPTKILYLTGPAGTGKTAIAGSIADTCDEQGLLAGSFFFASFLASETRRLKRYLVATLVYHLISPLDDDHPLRRAVLLAVQRDRSIFRKRLKDQLRLLLMKPLKDTRSQFDTSVLPKVFIIDGLDEVEAESSRESDRDPHDVRTENERDQEEILSALLYATSESTFPFRILIASRPERVIQTFFSNNAADVTREIFLDNKYDPGSDIALFLRASFAKIRRRYKLPALWPLEKDLEKLVYNASGQFIYAATIIRFLQGGKHPNPQALLNDILHQSFRCGEVGALASLDALYARILKSSPDWALAFRWIHAMDRLEFIPVVFVNQLLQDYEGQAEYLLENLTSLVWIPPAEDQSSPYHFHHKSFCDFIKDESRCGEELGHTSKDGDAFYKERLVNVILNKSPAVTLPETQNTMFLCDFVHVIGSRGIPYIVGSTESNPEVLTRSDAQWWVHFALKCGMNIFVIDWFTNIHNGCPSDSAGNCFLYCKHWRSTILRACRGLGWRVPNTIALFHEAICRHPSTDFKFSWSPYPYFNFSDSRSGSGDVDLLPTMTQCTVDGEYQATLDLVAAMYSRLPTDWISQIVRERPQDKHAFYSGLTAVIGDIRRELGIEESDILVDEDDRFDWGSDSEDGIDL